MPQFKDPVETDPAKRYKHLDWTKDTKAPMRAFLHYSPDGFDWTPYAGNPVMDTTPVIGRWGPTQVMGWDPIRETYAAYVECSHHMRAPFGKRIIGRAESPNMIDWTEAETILIPDELDFPDTEFYRLVVIPYEGLYLGVLWIFRTTNLTHHPEIIVSRDGFHFERNFREPFIFRGGRRVDFDFGSVYVNDAIVHGDKVLFYYIGTNRRSPEQMHDLGRRWRRGHRPRGGAAGRLRISGRRQGLGAAHGDRRAALADAQPGAPRGHLQGSRLVRPARHALLLLQRLATAPELDAGAHRRGPGHRRDQGGAADVQPPQDRGVHVRRLGPDPGVRARPGR